MRNLLLSLAALPLLASSDASAADRNNPTVIELYQSQGCSSCPPANANLNALADRDDLLPLSFAVTYWDRLGWKDTFADERYTDRQWDYARAAGRRNVATPQMIVNGTGVLIGHRAADITNAVSRYDRGSSGPDISWSASEVTVGGLEAGSATVWLVRYDTRSLNVPIGRGENSGRTLPHRNIVKQLTRLGDWKGAATSYPVPASSDRNLKTAVLVQAGRGGSIVAASVQR